MHLPEVMRTVFQERCGLPPNRFTPVPITECRDGD
jgi:hypothetical protein